MTTQEKRSIAIIPARGGSKRIPRKNVKPFCGKPMIAYSILAARNSKLFDTIIVSTDDQEIAQIATEYGARVPFTRPAELSDDFATTLSVIKHALNWFNSNDDLYDFACCIYATAPFIQIGHLENGYDLVTRQKYNFSFPVTTFSSPVFRALKKTRDGRLAMFWPEHLNTRTQDLPEAYHDTGQFYWGAVPAFLNTGSIFQDNAAPIIIPRYLAQDIDTQEDWDQAELIFKTLTSRTS